MTHIRPLEPEELDGAARLRTRSDVACFLDSSQTADHWRQSASALPTLGAFEGTELMACATLTVNARPRRRHLAALDLFCGPEGTAHAAALATAVVPTAERWLQLARLEIYVDPDAPWLAALLADGLSLEARCLSRCLRAGARRDDLLLGWVRPGLLRSSAAFAPQAPNRTDRPEVRLRPATLDDAGALTAMHHQDAVLRGTLQTPMRTAAQWREILQRPRVDASIIAEIDGQLAGRGALMLCPPPAANTVMLGMAVATEHQGRGVGTALLDGLVETSRTELDAHRVELGVDVDNVAAQGLYRKFGFAVEGTQRASGWRGDGYADTEVMGLVFG